MKLWTMVLFAAATLFGGCVGKVGDAASGSGGSSSSGTGNNTGSGTGNSVSSGTGNSVVSGVGGNAGNGSVITGAAGAGVTFCDTRGIAITSQVPRLTNAQYDRVLNDLLGVQTLTAANGVQPSTILATDQAGSLTELGWSSYQTVADMVATQVMADATLKKNFMACTPTGDGKTCFHDTIIKFGRKAFRRALTTDEIAAFDKIVSDGTDDHADGIAHRDRADAALHVPGLAVVHHARRDGATADASGNYTLSGTEVAQRLSFMLWGSIPDDMLNTAADNNQLTTPAQILTQAQRMLMSDKARLKVADFHRYYILMGPNTRWDQANKDTTLFPAFSTNLVPTLMAETEKFFDSVAFGKKGTFQDLFLSPTAFVTASTAPLYGLPASGFGTRLQGDGARREPAARLPDPRRLPERVRVLQPHVADSPRRLHHEAGAGHADRHAAARRGGDGAAARDGRSRTPTASRSMRRRRAASARPATTATSTRPASRWRRTTPSAPGRRRSNRSGRRSTPRPTSSSTAPPSTSTTRST